jgi:hypothetical protein
MTPFPAEFGCGALGLAPCAKAAPERLAASSAAPLIVINFFIASFLSLVQKHHDIRNAGRKRMFQFSWLSFDARHNHPRIGRIVIAKGLTRPMSRFRRHRSCSIGPL